MALKGLKQKTKQKQPFTQGEADYIYNVILTAMEDEAMYEGTTLFSHLVKLHRNFVENEHGQKSVKGVDTFGLILEAIDAAEDLKMTKTDYREEIRDQGKSYMFHRIIHDRTVRKPLEKIIAEGLATEAETKTITS